MESFRIDDLVQRLLERVPPAWRSVQADLESNFRAVLRSQFERLDLVSHERFDVQAELLARTQKRLAALEKRIAELEQAEVAVKRG